MPIKNPHPQFFKAAIQSVIHQTSKDWNLIIIGEAGELRALEELLGPFKAHPCISIIQNQTRLLSGALNTGLRAAKTDFVCILLGDDLLAPNAIKILRKNIQSNPEVNFFHSSRRVIDEHGDFISKIYQSKEKFEIKDFINSSPVKHLLCWKREKALSIGGIDENLGLHGADDYDFPWSMAEAGCVFKAIPECLYYYRDHRSHYRLTTHIPLDAQVAELRKIWEKHRIPEEEIQRQLDSRLKGYLQQALYKNESDKRKREEAGINPSMGWKERYPSPVDTRSRERIEGMKVNNLFCSIVKMVIKKGYSLFSNSQRKRIGADRQLGAVNALKVKNEILSSSDAAFLNEFILPRLNAIASLWQEIKETPSKTNQLYQRLGFLGETFKVRAVSVSSEVLKPYCQHSSRSLEQASSPSQLQNACHKIARLTGKAAARLDPSAIDALSDAAFLNEFILPRLNAIASLWQEIMKDPSKSNRLYQQKGILAESIRHRRSGSAPPLRHFYDRLSKSVEGKDDFKQNYYGLKKRAYLLRDYCDTDGVFQNKKYGEYRNIEKLQNKFHFQSQLTYIMHKNKRKNLFLVIATARSGSTLLITYLNSIPGVYFFDEVLSYDRSYGLPPEQFIPIRGLQHIKRCLYYPKECISGAKLLMNQLSGCDISMTELVNYFPQVKYLIVVRENIIDQFISEKIADATNSWINVPVPNHYRIDLRPEDLDEYCKEIRGIYRDVLNGTKKKDRMIITYEDLSKDPQGTFEKYIFPFFNIPTSTVHTNLVKQNKLPSSERVSNWDEIKELAESSIGYQHYSNE